MAKSPDSVPILPASSSSTPPPMKFLVIDDDPVFRTFLSQTLALEPADQVTVAAEGLAAWRILDDPKRHFDVVFLDLTMPPPGPDGFELLRRIRASQWLKNLEVVLCTGSSDRKTVETAVSLGVRHYIVKPCKPAAVIAKIDQIRGSATPWDDQRMARL